jgi:hypothetical protein
LQAPSAGQGRWARGINDLQREIQLAIEDAEKKRASQAPQQLEAPDTDAR